ncbi:OmpA family protein [Flavobacterium sp. XGLA_31]|uniref:OmpA family protein n=1 Tax=Flavobacterium sp. XGLA_31 TaxID=3447666 RepID=UPI003F2D67F9
MSQQKFQVFFDFNKDWPTIKSEAEINGWITANPDIEVVRMIGYCDSVDNREYNKDLAQRRINTMLDWLRKQHVKIKDSIELKALGKDFKLSKNQNENRKVEIFYAIPNRKETLNPPKDEEESFIKLDERVAEEKATLEQKFAKAKKGDLIRINHISFYFNSEKIMEQSKPLLEELLQIMLDNPKLIIEIHGHICCNPNPMDTKLSYRRALVILKYLTNHGIKVNRLSFKGFGSNDPIYKVPERNEKERAANRRVEILIVNK